MIENRNLNPEKRLILACLHIEGFRENTFVAVREKGLNQEILREEALRQGVLPLVYTRLKETGLALLLDKDLETWQALYRANGERNLRLSRQLIQILELFSRQGIDLLPFKGPTLAIQAYNDLSIRQISDLDFLVRSQDALRSVNVLIEAGFFPDSPLTSKLKQILTRTGKEMWFKNRNTQIDLHQQIPEGPASFALRDILWADLGFVELLNRKVPVLSRDNTVLVLCLHGAEDGWDSLNKITDLGYLIKANPDIDFKALTARAKGLRMKRLLYLGLALIGEICGVALPQFLQVEIDRDQKVKRLASQIIQRLVVDSDSIPSIAFIPKAMDSFRDKIGYLTYFSLTPRTSDIMTIPLPDSLYPFYYLIHPLRLLSKYGSSLIRVFLNGKSRTRTEEESPSS